MEASDLVKNKESQQRNFRTVVGNVLGAVVDRVRLVINTEPRVLQVVTRPFFSSTIFLFNQKRSGVCTILFFMHFLAYFCSFNKKRKI